MDSVATEPRLATDQHDAVLLLALGSLSLFQHFEQLIRPAADPAVRPLEVDDPLVLAALGVVSTGRSLRRWLEEAAPPAAAPDRSVPSIHPATPSDILR
jgi:hypothetical protein